MSVDAAGLMYVTISSEPYILLIILVQRFCAEMKVRLHTLSK
jgi:hypothetical protein